MKNAAHNRTSRLLPLLVAVGLALAASTVSAGVNVWTTNGPEGGDIRALAIDPANPATLYAGTSGGGVFKSTNGGGTWTAINPTTGPCVANATTLCLNNSRYRVQTRWFLQDGSSGAGQVINISATPEPSGSSHRAASRSWSRS